MIFVWLFGLLLGMLGFLWATVVLHYEWVWAVVYALALVVLVRGIASWVKRYLVLTERVAEEKDPETRTIETNRYIFWRRFISLMLLVSAYFGIAYEFFGMQPGEALAVLPSLVVNALVIVVQLGAFLVFNFMILFLPFVLFGRMGRETLEPGDASYEVKVEDVRGQRSAVTEMMRILRLMEQGHGYVKAGGKREKGVLFVGPPGTGKTMLAKGIASSLHMPIVITSGAAFQGMFLGMDMVNVWTMVRAAKKKAKRWGGCAIFIDEFDALGNRRAGMGGTGGMGGMGGMFGGGQLGLNMLLVLMDGVDNPGFFKKLFRRSINLTLDGIFLPRSIHINGSRLSLRVPPLRPPRYNLFFMGATNRPSVLDEAVTRPGRFGRTITFRMPTREDRKDIAALYFDKKSHDPDLDTPHRREEFARVTEGYSPAMIDQVLSLALMYAFEEERQYFTWRDLREAMGNVEAGLAEPVTYTEREALATARHELGHAIAARYYLPEMSSVRLSIKKRGSILGFHRNVANEEEFAAFRTRFAGEIRHGLGAIACERVFYGENSNGVTSDLVGVTGEACQMVGMWAMGPDRLRPELNPLAINLGQDLISRVQATAGALEGGSFVGTVLGNPHSRRQVAQVLGAAFIDCWRLMHVNQEAIDQAAEALIAQGELVGDEIIGLLDSVGLREPDAQTPYPEMIPALPDLDKLGPAHGELTAS